MASLLSTAGPPGWRRSLGKEEKERNKEEEEERDPQEKTGGCNDWRGGDEPNSALPLLLLLVLLLQCVCAQRGAHTHTHTKREGRRQRG